MIFLLKILVKFQQEIPEGPEEILVEIPEEILAVIAGCIERGIPKGKYLKKSLRE